MYSFHALVEDDEGAAAAEPGEASVGVLDWAERKEKTASVQVRFLHMSHVAVVVLTISTKEDDADGRGI